MSEQKFSALYVDNISLVIIDIELILIFFFVLFPADSELDDYGCESGSPASIVSPPIPVNTSHPGVDNSWCLIDEAVRPPQPPIAEATQTMPSQQPRRLEKYAPIVKARRTRI